MLRLVPDGTDIKFMKSRMIAMVFSVVMMIGSLALFWSEGLNLGIDFKGGSSVEIGADHALDVSLIRSSLSGLGLGEIKVQEHGTPESAMIRIERQPGDEGVQASALIKIQDALDEAFLAEVYNKDAQSVAVDRFSALLESSFSGLDIDENGQSKILLALQSELENVRANLSGDIATQKKLVAALKVNFTEAITHLPQSNEAESEVVESLLTAFADAFHGVHYRSTSSIGPTVSGELAVDGTKAVIFAVIAVMIYIWLRFEWQFGLGAVMALTHDVILTIGFFALTRLEFNLSIIAALLTIVGYSLNDTVVVYDRVRENIRKFLKRDVEDVINTSLNQTLSRTITTSLTTLLALFSLYILGGPAVSGFTAAMIWGVLIGTYSSVFIASPMLLILKVERAHLVNDDDGSKDKSTEKA